MRVNHVKESGAVRAERKRGARRIAKLELDCLSVSVPMARSRGERDTSLMTRNILYGGQLAGGVECQKSEGRGSNNLKMYPHRRQHQLILSDVYTSYLVEVQTFRQL